MLSPSQHVIEPFAESQPAPLVSYGLPYAQACRQFIDSYWNCKRVYLLISASLAEKSDVFNRLQKALGTKIVGARIGLKPHTLWSEILEVLDDMRPLDVDCIVSVGAGSLTDAIKVIAWALANGVCDEDDLAKLVACDSPGYADLKLPTIRSISVPTSLSGGEYTSFAGATNDKTQKKQLFTPPVQNPQVVVLDPEVAATMPMRLFLGSGIRAVDHCVETVCSLKSNEMGDQISIKGLELLVPALLAYKRDPSNLEAIRNAQLGALEAVKTSIYVPEKGGSHAIGHMLGPLGVAHGETSCILLPAVCRYNALKGANVQRQEKLTKALLASPHIQSLLSNAKNDLASIIENLVKALGLPRALKDVGISGDLFDKLAENSLLDPWAKENPVSLVRKEQILEILDMVAD
ncbi:hypothetical protein LTR84_006520 [Exophiala bonariae]|uniref:Alcohol dehydrogenase iron-type/glycerol dehydrogenase GldA domain-containing protein n=1 Tax=Exophiala bonariae TaxID=1690606 RepID=A0AAV9N0J1_9EURO|nr:hypothetical protein LTR84_006520 [Exophiala bonariae]